MLITGDYKFDQTPVDGDPADVSRLAELGREGVLCLCGDSTNADRPGWRRRSRASARRCWRSSSRCKGRIIVTSFASNVHRVQQAIDAAAQLDRRVALVGRSMRKNFNIASNLGIADAPDGLFIQPKEIEDFPDEKVVVISTGSQGEPLSALRRMAHNDHRDVELHSGDTVIFSATPIPGNERSVNETIDRIFQIGAQVVTAADAPIHASGHGWQEELKLMLNLTKPHYVLPVPRRPQAAAPACRAGRVGRRRPRKTSSSGATASRSSSTSPAPRFGEDVHAGMIFVDGVDVGEPDDVRAARPPQALRRRHLHRRRDDLVRRRLPGRRPGGDLPRRPVRRGGGDGLRRGAARASSRTRSPTPPRTRSGRSRCSRRTSTTTSPSSSTRSCAAARWCCRSSSRCEGPQRGRTRRRGRPSGQGAGDLLPRGEAGRNLIYGGLVVAAVGLLIAYLLRPWFHGLVMFFLQASADLDPGGRHHRRLRLHRQARDSRRGATPQGRGIVAGVVLVASLFSLIFFSILESALVNRSIYENTTYTEIPGLPAGGTVRIVPREVAVEIASSGFNSPTETLTDFPLGEDSGGQPRLERASHPGRDRADLHQEEPGAGHARRLQHRAPCDSG